MAAISGSTATALLVASMAATVAGAGMSAYSAYQQGQAQQRQAEFQEKLSQRNAKIAEENARMAEEEGRQAKRIGYENAVRKRQEAAQIVGSQRAAFGASGAQVDQGAALDLALDTVEKGELDAFQLRQQGLDTDYNKRIEAWNFREQGTGQQLQGRLYGMQTEGYSPWLSAGGTLLQGVGQAGSNYARLYGGGGTEAKFDWNAAGKSAAGINPFNMWKW